MKTILFIGLIQSLFASFLIFSEKKKKTHHYILGTWMVLLAIQFSSDLLFNYEIDSFLSNYNIIIFPFLQGPFIYLYTQYTIYGTKKVDTKSLLHLIPFVFFSILFFSFKGTGVFSPNNMEYNEDGMPFIQVLYGVSAYSINIIYAYLTYKLIKESRKQIKDVFSSETSEIKLSWIKTIVYLSIIFTVGFYSFSSIAYGLFHSELKYIGYLLNIGLVSEVFIISYYGFRQPNIFYSKSNEDLPSKDSKRYKRSGLKPEQAELYINQITQYMNKEKPYLDTDFSLYALSEKLGISQYYITQSLNETLGKNFYSFVNEFRVEEAKEKLLDPKNNHLTVLGIGYESGFNSKSTFYSIFKKTTGKSPSEYKKTLKAS